jgi:predicted dehydrogenase
VAVEVPAAGTLEDIWALVDKAEQTRLHCMMLENSVYDHFERVALEMARQGVFGEIVHAEGAYLHRLDFDQELWRKEYNRTHRGDVYPTHGIGPVCQALGIHRTDRMQTLVSLDTGAFTGRAITGDASFANADQTNTLLKTAGGKTILIEHNVMTPRPYSRMYQLVGTQGYAAKYPVPQICLLQDGEEVIYEGERLKSLMAPYDTGGLPPELLPAVQEVDAKHEGMDLLMDYRLVLALREGRPLDMDVYDLAEWCALAPLSLLSVENGGAPVEFPDFTRVSARSGR